MSGHNNYGDLSFFAGKKALSIIRDEGLRPQSVKIVAGAAGGPKWFVLNHLDRVIFSSWFKDRTQPLFLIGSSIGAWRFAAVAQNNPLEAIGRLMSAYLGQSYKSSKPTPEEVTLESKKILDSLLDDSRICEVLEHPYLRLNILADRCRWPVASDKKIFLGPGLAGAALVNAVGRKYLKFFFERFLFYDPREIPPFFEMDGIPTRQTPLSEDILKFALLASGSIPLVMSGLNEIPGVPKGIYRDGGLVDYHLDIPFMEDGEGIVLFPHYMDRVIPGWFDKNIQWRRPLESNMDKVLLVSPSREFVENLPYGKIPDRKDFRYFKGRQKERIKYWNTVIQKSERLGEAFMEAALSGRIREFVKPMPAGA